MCACGRVCLNVCECMYEYICVRDSCQLDWNRTCIFYNMLEHAQGFERKKERDTERVRRGGGVHREIEP